MLCLPLPAAAVITFCELAVNRQDDVHEHRISDVGSLHSDVFCLMIPGVRRVWVVWA